MGINVETANYKVAGKFDDQITSKSKKAFAQFQKNAKVAFKAAAVAIAGVTTALVAMTSKTLDSFDAVGKFADRAGITTDALQEMRFAFDLAGVGVEAIDKAFLTFGKRLGKARQDIGALKGGLKGGEEALLEALLATENTTDAIQLMFEAMANAESQTRKLAIADAAFGAAGLRMTAAFNDGIDSFNEARQSAQRLGIVIDESLIRKAERLNDEMTLVSAVIKSSFQSGLINGFVDDFGELHEMVVDPDFRQGMEDIGELMGGFLRLLVKNAKTISITSASIAALFLASNVAGAVGLKGRLAGILSLLAAVSAGILVFNEFAAAEENVANKGSKTAKVVIEMAKETRELRDASEDMIDTFSNFGASFPPLQSQFIGMTEGMAGGQNEFIEGARAGLSEYGETVGTVATQAQRAFSSGFQRMEDTLVQFFKTGKFETADFFDFFITELFRLQAQKLFLQPLAGFLDGFLGSFGGVQGTSPEAVPFGGFNSNLINSGGVPDISGFGSFGDFDTGIDRVPRNMFARIHEGETVLNQKAADNFRSGGLGNSVSVTIINQSGGEVQTRQTRNAGGGVDLEFMIGKAVAKDIKNGGPAHQAIRKTFATNVRTNSR